MSVLVSIDSGTLVPQHSAGGCQPSPVVCPFLPLSAVLFPRLQGVLCAEPGVQAVLAVAGHGCTGQKHLQNIVLTWSLWGDKLMLVSSFSFNYGRNIFKSIIIICSGDESRDVCDNIVLLIMVCQTA